MIVLAKAFEKKEVLSVKTISKKQGISFDFLEKIISNLERAGFLKGKKGVFGGYSLAKNPKKITVGDIINSLEGKSKLVNCVLCVKSKKCVAKNVWNKIDKSLNKTLESIKLADLI